MKLYRLTERYTGQRFVYVEAETRTEALAKARAGDLVDVGDTPTHYDWRYVGPVKPVEAVPAREEKG